MGVYFVPAAAAAAESMESADVGQVHRLPVCIFARNSTSWKFEGEFAGLIVYYELHIDFALIALVRLHTDLKSFTEEIE